MADQGPVALPEGRGASHPHGAAQDARELKRAARADRQRAREVQSGATRAAVELLQRLLADYRKHLSLAPEDAREEIEEFIRRGGVHQATAHNASQQIA